MAIRPKKFLEGLIYGIDFELEDFKDFSEEARQYLFVWNNVAKNVDTDRSMNLVRISTVKGVVYIYSYDIEDVTVRKGLAIIRGHETQSIFDMEDLSFETKYTR